MDASGLIRFVSRQPSAARAPCRAARDPVYERV